MNIWNVKQRVTKKPPPIHFVDIKPSLVITKKSTT